MCIKLLMHTFRSTNQVFPASLRHEIKNDMQRSVLPTKGTKTACLLCAEPAGKPLMLLRIESAKAGIVCA